MSHPKTAETLPAMKALLRDLETTKVIYPDGLSILALRHDVRKKIAEAENARRPARGSRSK